MNENALIEKLLAQQIYLLKRIISLEDKVRGGASGISDGQLLKQLEEGAKEVHLRTRR